MEIKDKILKKAFELFLEKGVFEIYVADVVREMNLNKSDVYNCFKTRDELINEVIGELWGPHLDEIIMAAESSGDESTEKILLRIFEKYSEMKSYLKNNFNVSNFNYESIMFLTSEVLKSYSTIPKLITNFNNKLLEKIENVIDEGKKLGEILSTVNSKSVAMQILSSLQSNILLWGMNQKINIRLLYETSFKYLWDSIKCQESNSINSYDNKKIEMQLVRFYEK